MNKAMILCAALLLPAAALSAQVEPQRVEVIETRAPLALATKAAPGRILIQPKHVTLDLVNAPLPEAVKLLGAQAGEKIEVASDVPTEARITVRARNVPFGTALELIAANAGAGTSLTVTDGKPVFRIVKEQSGSDVMGLSSNHGFFFQALPQAGEKIRAVTSDGVIELAPPNGFAANVTVPTTALYRMHFNELRSTFTCPHCKGQVTSLRTRQDPKCPKCGRVFQGDWQYCPADGTKRPATSDDWRYCPLCGKRIDLEKPRPEEPAK